MSVPESRFRHVLGHLAGGVAVVTSVGPGGEPSGLTATALCSVSLEPPLVLASVARAARTHAAIEASGVYGINLLASDQESLAVRFAGKEADKFRGLEVEEGVTGAPRLVEAMGFVDCRVTRHVPVGDHTLFVGGVEAAGIRGDGAAKPLVYHLGRYGTLAD